MSYLSFDLELTVSFACLFLHYYRWPIRELQSLPHPKRPSCFAVHHCIKTYKIRHFGSQIFLQILWSVTCLFHYSAIMLDILCIQTSAAAHPAFYPMGTGGPYPRGKAWLGHDADNLPPSIAEVKNQQELYLVSLSRRLHGV
jgi:hypothetical protein